MTVSGTRALAPRERVVDHAFGVAWAISRHTPEPVAERLLEGAADRVFRRQGTGVRQLESNLRRAVPEASPDELNELVANAMRSYFRYWHEAFRLPSWTADRIVDGVVTSNEQPLREAIAAGRGAIVALPHMANWDRAGAWACLTGMPVSTVAERLRPDALYDRFVAYREQLGMEVVALTGAVNPLTAMRLALGEGRLVCLLADRDLTGSGVQVDLLGERAQLPGGAAALARMTGAPLVAATLTFHELLLRIDFSDPIPAAPGGAGLREMTQQVADHFTAGIRRDPVDWHMLQPVFTADVAASADESGAMSGQP